MTDTLKLIILGLIEGFTEFLPVSSTGHLIIFGHIINFTGEVADVIEVSIQLGAILSVLVIYKDRFFSLLNFQSTNTSWSQGFSGKSGIFKLACVTAPALIIGFALHKVVKLLFEPLPVAIALIVGGVVMLLVENRKTKATVHTLEEISPQKCFLIGLCQCLALWPGISRSGSTIVGGMLLGLDRTVAAQFSFLAAVPVIFAATSYDLYKNLSLLGDSDFQLLIVGFIVSFLSAFFAIRFFLKLLQTWTLLPFAWYRIVLGVLIICFYSYVIN
jgi:undecaprenyl-diphosphatase